MRKNKISTAPAETRSEASSDVSTLVERSRQPIAAAPGQLSFASFDGIPTKTIREYPVVTVRDWDPPAVANALRQAAAGNFESISDFSISMRAESSWAPARARRINGLVRTPIEVLPADDSPLSAYIAAKVRQRVREMLPTLQLQRVLGSFLDLSLGIGTLDWRLDEDCDEWIPVLRYLNPRWTFYDSSRRVLYYAHDGDQSLTDITAGDGIWFCVSDWVPGDMPGIVSQTSLAYLFKRFSELDWSVFLDNYADPIIQASCPNGGTSDAAQQKYSDWARQIAQGKGSRIVLTPRGVDQNSDYDIKIHQMLNSAPELFQRRAEYSDERFQVAWLGANLSTEVNGGSYAAAQVHKGVERELVQGDAEIFSEAITQQVVRLYVEQNFGKATCASSCPIVGWNVEVEEDAAQVSATLKNIGDAMKSFVAAGYAMDEDDLSKKFGIRIYKISQQPPALNQADAPSATDPVGEETFDQEPIDEDVEAPENGSSSLQADGMNNRGLRSRGNSLTWSQYVQRYITKHPTKRLWTVHAEDGKSLGTYSSLKEAKERLKQVEGFSHKTE